MSRFKVLPQDSLHEALVQREDWLAVRTHGVLGSGAIETSCNRCSAASGSNYGFEQVVIRNNMIRRASTTAGSTATQKGVYVKRGRNVVLENNIIHPGTVVDNGVRFKECATLRPFSNRAVDQTLLRAFNEDTNKQTPELETDIEEAFML